MDAVELARRQQIEELDEQAYHAEQRMKVLIQVLPTKNHPQDIKQAAEEIASLAEKIESLTKVIKLLEKLDPEKH